MSKRSFGERETSPETEFLIKKMKMTNDLLIFNLQQQFECPICLESYELKTNPPLMIHTESSVCQKCSIIMSQSTPCLPYLSCPFCQILIAIPPEGFPINYSLKNTIEIVHQHQNQIKDDDDEKKLNLDLSCAEAEQILDELGGDLTLIFSYLNKYKECQTMQSRGFNKLRIICKNTLNTINELMYSPLSGLEWIMEIMEKYNDDLSLSLAQNAFNLLKILFSPENPLILAAQHKFLDINGVTMVLKVMKRHSQFIENSYFIRTGLDLLHYICFNNAVIKAKITQLEGIPFLLILLKDYVDDEDLQISTLLTIGTISNIEDKEQKNQIAHLCVTPILTSLQHHRTCAKVQITGINALSRILTMENAQLLVLNGGLEFLLKIILTHANDRNLHAAAYEVLEYVCRNQTFLVQAVKLNGIQSMIQSLAHHESTTYTEQGYQLLFKLLRANSTIVIEL